MSMYSRKTVAGQRDNELAEVDYPHDAIGTDDMPDLIERLNIGTLRRDQLKAARAAADQAGDEPVMDDDELEEFYRNGGAHSAKNRLHRHPSRISSVSVGSCASTQSGSSAGEAAISRHSSSSSRLSSQSRSVETQEMGIQTTIGKSNGLAISQSDGDEAKGKEHRRSRKDKVKKMLKRKPSTSSTEIEIRIEEEPQQPKLPQGFVVKYMGKRDTKGMWGSKHTRAVVEDVVDAISKMPKSEDLPLVNLDVYYQGLEMRPHTKNKIKSFKQVQIPIQFISYGIQDTVYPRIFCFIMVKEMSSQDKSMECHVYACDSNKNARRIAGCMAMAFEAYTEHLKGSAVKFSVDITMDPNTDKASFEV